MRYENVVCGFVPTIAAHQATVSRSCCASASPMEGPAVIGELLHHAHMAYGGRSSDSEPRQLVGLCLTTGRVCSTCRNEDAVQLAAMQRLVKHNFSSACIEHIDAVSRKALVLRVCIPLSMSAPTLASAP